MRRYVPPVALKFGEPWQLVVISNVVQPANLLTNPEHSTLCGRATEAFSVTIT